MQLARRLFPCLLCCLALLTAAYFALPRVISAYLNTNLPSKLPFSTSDIQISEISLSKTVASCTFGSETSDALQLAKVTINYSLAGLLKKKINNIDIDTGYVNLVKQHGAFKLPGIKETQPPGEKSSSTDFALLPLAASAVKISNLHLLLTGEDSSTIALVVSAELRPTLKEEEDGFLLTELTVDMKTSGELESAAKMRIVNEGEIQTASFNIHLDNLAYMASLMRGKGVSAIGGVGGAADINGEFGYLFANSSFTASGEITGALLQTPLKFATKGRTEKGTTELSYAISGRPFAAGHFSAESLALQGTVNIAGDNIKTSNDVALAMLRVPTRFLEAETVQANIPLSVGPGGLTTSQPATVKINGVRREKLHLGNLTATASLASETASFNVNSALGFHPDVNLSCQGTAQFNGELSMDCTLPETNIDSTHFDTGIPFPVGSHFSGRIGGTMHLALNDGAPSGMGKFELTEGRYTSGTNIVSGITTSLAFPRLPILESAPGQICTIKDISAGKIQFSDGKFTFHVENPDTIFIEKSRFSWCGGKVESGGLRLSSTAPELHTTLYCDRLDMAELLAQVGLVDTEGDGSLNGKLPVTIGKGSIAIEDGFLFSTPGVSGIVHFNNTQQIKKGLPDMGQAAYLDYAVKSLENFSYNWTKLTFNQEQHDLLVTLQLDGAPAEPLPFGYRNGNIVKVETGKGIQHPIRLDVNFRFPVKDLLRYGKNVQSLMESK